MLYFLINLFLFGSAGSLLPHGLFSGCSEWRLLSGCRTWASHFGGSLLAEYSLSGCDAQA